MRASIRHVTPEKSQLEYDFSRAIRIVDNIPGFDALLVPCKHKDDKWEEDPSKDTQRRFRAPHGRWDADTHRWRVFENPDSPTGWSWVVYSKEHGAVVA